MNRVFLFAFSLVACSAAMAADNGIYLGAGVVRSSIDANTAALTQAANNVKLDDSDNGFKVIVGVRPLDWLAVEANYIDLGKVSAANSTARAAYGLKGVDAFGVLLIGPPFLDFIVKAGAIRWQADDDLSSSLGALKDDTGFDLAYGAGIQARFGSLAARLEYERFDIDNTEETSALSLSVTWTFL